MGHWCKTASLTLLEPANGDEPAEDAPVDNGVVELITTDLADLADLAEIFFHTIQGKKSGSSMKLQGTLEGRSVFDFD